MPSIQWAKQEKGVHDRKWEKKEESAVLTNREAIEDVVSEKLSVLLIHPLSN